MKGLPMKKFSIIMPTLNSEKTIEHALKSIREQEYDQELIEILVVDGGSSDCTLSIAQKYNAKILHNKKKLPEIAKEIGFRLKKAGADEKVAWGELAETSGVSSRYIRDIENQG